jgi:hypothetical protein
MHCGRGARKVIGYEFALLGQSFLVRGQGFILGTDYPVTDSVYKMLL